MERRGGHVFVDAKAMSNQDKASRETQGKPSASQNKAHPSPSAAVEQNHQKRAPATTEKHDGDPAPDLVLTRQPSPVHPGQGQQFSTTKPSSSFATEMPYGFERFVQLYEGDIAYKFEQFQNKPPIDYILAQERREHLHDPSSIRPPVIEDWTTLDKRMWFSPYRKGQKYWDYCRDKWMEKESRLGAACAPISCLYSLWTITNNCLENGGFVFMMMYLFVVVTFIIPVIYMELTIGQFHRFGPLKTLKQACPLFRGVAFLMLLWCFFDYLLTMTRLTWMLFYVGATFRQIFPWKHCDKEWNTIFCKDPHQHSEHLLNFTERERTPAVEYFRARVLRFWKSDYANDIGAFQPFYMQTHDPQTRKTIPYYNPNKHLNGLERYSFYEPGYYLNIDLFLCFLLLFFYLRRAVKWQCPEMGRRMLVAFCCAIAFTGFCIVSRSYSTINDHSHKAMEWFFDFEENIKFLFCGQAWKNVIIQAVAGSGIGSGIYITFGSHNMFPNDEIKSAALISGLGSFLLHYLIAIFFVISHFTIYSGNGFKSNPLAYGNDTFFDIFPQAVTFHARPSFAWFMFALMFLGIILFSLLRVMCSLHVLKVAHCDKWKEYYEPARFYYDPRQWQRSWRQARQKYWMLSAERKTRLVTKYMCLAGAFHLFTFSRGGFLYMYLVESFWYKYFPVTIVFLEGLAIFFFLGIRHLNQYIRVMTSWQCTLWFRFAWKFFPILFPVVYYIQLRPTMNNVEFDGVPFHEYFIYAACGVCAVVPVLLLIYIILIWILSPAAGFCGKLVYEVTPEHDRPDIVLGIKASSRLHWIHNMIVPRGLARGDCLRSIEYPNIHPHFPKTENALLEVFWLYLHFNLLNKTCRDVVDFWRRPPKEDGKCCSRLCPIRKLCNLCCKKINTAGDCCSGEKWDEVDSEWELLPASHYPMRFMEGEREPEYLQNEQIKRVEMMKRERHEVDRDRWLNDLIFVKMGEVKSDESSVEKEEESSSSDDFREESSNEDKEKPEEAHHGQENVEEKEVGGGPEEHKEGHKVGTDSESESSAPSGDHGSRESKSTTSSGDGSMADSEGGKGSDESSSSKSSESLKKGSDELKVVDKANNELQVEPDVDAVSDSMELDVEEATEVDVDVEGTADDEKEVDQDKLSSDEEEWDEEYIEDTFEIFNDHLEEAVDEWNSTKEDFAVDYSLKKFLDGELDFTETMKTLDAKSEEAAKKEFGEDYDNTIEALCYDFEEYMNDDFEDKFEIYLDFTSSSSNSDVSDRDWDSNDLKIGNKLGSFDSNGLEEDLWIDETSSAGSLAEEKDSESDLFESSESDESFLKSNGSDQALEGMKRDLKKGNMSTSSSSGEIGSDSDVSDSGSDESDSEFDRSSDSRNSLESSEESRPMRHAQDSDESDSDEETTFGDGFDHDDIGSDSEEEEGSDKAAEMGSDADEEIDSQLDLNDYLDMYWFKYFSDESDMFDSDYSDSPASDFSGHKRKPPEVAK